MVTYDIDSGVLGCPAGCAKGTMHAHLHTNMACFFNLIIGRASSVDDMAESSKIKELMDENEKLKERIEILTQENRKFVYEIMFQLYLITMQIEAKRPSR